MVAAALFVYPISKPWHFPISCRIVSPETSCYRAGVESASREVIQITSELNSLRDVLESLLRIVEKSQSNDSKDGSRLATFELLIKEGGPLMTCKAELEALKSKLEPERGWRKMRNRLVWPLKEGEVRRTLDGLERLKGTMGLALSADQA